MGSEALLSERFRVVSRLGEGAYGTVYEATDQLRGELVAVKVLHRISAEAIFRFKREFRSLRDLRHPNLVELGELIEREGQWLFTMELVRGSDVLMYVRPRRVAVQTGEADHRGRGLDEARLRDALGQLALGLHELHLAGKIHRDIKPSNVRVSHQDRVVLLDFGLIKDDRDDSGSAAASMVGTAAYMSPEQAAGRPLTPASDWYSVGVLLYEALTGRRPFTGSALQVLFDKQRQQPAAPSALVEDLPSDLEALCTALLQIDPAARPDGEQVLTRLGRQAALGSSRVRAGLVGRTCELQRLDEELAAMLAGGSPKHIYVAGEPGAGKSRLLAEWAQRLTLQHPDALVLRGGAHESESMPFQAMDGVIDGLSRALCQLTEGEVEGILPTRLGALRSLFPALGRIEWIARRAESYEEPPEPWALQDAGFSALKGLLGRVAQERPLILVLDDLHWADGESLRLVDRLVAGVAPPRALVVAAGLPLSRCPPPVRRLLELSLCPGPNGVIELGGLSQSEGAELARRGLARDAHGWGSCPPADLAEQIAERAGGQPVFIDLFVRHGHAPGLSGGQVPSLETVLRHRVEQLGPPERQTLELLTVAGSAVRFTILRGATRMRRGAFRKCTSALLGAGLVAEVGFGDTASLVILQRPLRDAVLGALGAQEVARAHRQLADAYLADDAQDAEALSVHLGAAGDTDRAVRFAVLAAGAALEGLSFDRAAHLYRLALELMPTEDTRRRRRTLAAYAEALDGAGRPREAATAYLQALEGAPPVEGAELRARAVQQLMRSGEVQQAMGHVEALLGPAEKELVASRWHAHASLVYQRARLRLRGLSYEQRGSTWIAPDELHYIDLLWVASHALSTHDPVRAEVLHVRQLELALRAGEPYRLARAMALEAMSLQFRWARSRRRVGQLLAQARLLAESSGDPHAHAVVSLGEGAAAYSVGRFGQALAKFEEAESTLRRRCRSVSWELAVAQQLSLSSLQYTGRFDEIDRRATRVLAEARDRGDRFLESLVGLSVGYWPAVLRGELERARLVVRDSRSAWGHGRGRLQDSLACVAEAHVALCLSPETAWEHFQRAFRHVDARSVARIPTLRVLLGSLRAQCDLASAVHGGRTSRHPWRAALVTARRLSLAKLGYGPALGRLIEAAVAAHQGDPTRAVTLLSAATAGFHSHEMNLYAWASRYREGQLIGGHQGQEQVERAVSWLNQQGVAAPRRLLEAAAPGFAPRSPRG